MKLTHEHLTRFRDPIAESIREKARRDSSMRKMTVDAIEDLVTSVCAVATSQMMRTVDELKDSN